MLFALVGMGPLVQSGSLTLGRACIVIVVSALFAQVVSEASARASLSLVRSGLNKISEFLDDFIIEGNRFSDAILHSYRTMFESTVAFLWDALGAESFCVIGSSKHPTKIVYDPLMYVANSGEVVPHRATLIAKKDVLRSELATMYTEHKALFSGRRTNFTDTQNRNRCVSKAFAAALTKAKKS